MEIMKFYFFSPQVMETERMIYLVTEYASGGEIFGKCELSCDIYVQRHMLLFVLYFSKQVC